MARKEQNETRHALQEDKARRSVRQTDGRVRPGLGAKQARSRDPDERRLRREEDERPQRADVSATRDEGAQRLRLMASFSRTRW